MKGRSGLLPATLLIAALLPAACGPGVAAARGTTRPSGPETAPSSPPSTTSLPEYRITPVEGVQEITVRSRILGEERTLLIRLPQGYADSDQAYPVLLMLDADWHFSTAAADVELLSECSYVRSHPIPRLIVAGVVNVDRNRDFTPTLCPEQIGMRFPTSGGAEAFRRFLVEEALPVIDASYRTRPFRILAGWSLGGLFAIDTVLGGSTAFDSYLAISPSLWWDGGLILKRLEEDGARMDPPQPRQLVVTLGSVEKDRGSTVARATGEFLAYLDEHPLPNLTVEEVPIDGMGHEYATKLAYFYGLATVFGDLNPPAETLAGGLDAIDAYYAALSRRYRYALAVPEDVYSRIGWRLFEAGRAEESGEVFRRWVERHPESALALASLGSYCKETGDAVQAVDLFRRAIELEDASAHPRQAFINDLRRDVDALQAEN